MGWVGLGVRESSRVSVRARHRLLGGKDSRLNEDRVVLGLHVATVASPSFLLHNSDLLRVNSSM